MSRAGDGPKVKVAENGRVVGAFLKVLAPGLGGCDGWVGETIKQLAGEGGGERVVRLGEDFKVTAWHEGRGCLRGRWSRHGGIWSRGVWRSALGGMCGFFSEDYRDVVAILPLDSENTRILCSANNFREKCPAKESRSHRTWPEAARESARYPCPSGRAISLRLSLGNR